MTDPSSPDRLSLTEDMRRHPRRSFAPMALAPETLAAYIDGRLSPDERRTVEAAIAVAPEAYGWLVDALAIARELPEGQDEGTPAAVPGERHAPVGPIRRRWWPLAVSGLATAATLVLLLRGVPVAPAPERTIAELADRIGAPDLAPWVTGGFAVEAPITARGGGAERVSTELLRMVADLERAAETTPSAAAEHALGVALLVLGGDGRNEALSHLERAAAADPRPAFLSDLAAASLDRAIRTGASTDAERALELAGRVLDVAPGSREALYNRALALQTLDRTSEAIAVWTEFLATPAGPGHDAAREHLARLRERRGGGMAPPPR